MKTDKKVMMALAMALIMLTVPMAGYLQIEEADASSYPQGAALGHYTYKIGFETTSQVTSVTLMQRDGETSDTWTSVSEGDFSWNRNTGIGPFNMFYAAINVAHNDNTDAMLSEKGQVAYILDPYDLTKAIDGNGGYSSLYNISDYNIMLIIPTIYYGYTSETMYISDAPIPELATSEARAHTVGTTVYPYIGIGVYEAYVDSTNGLMSKSGVLPNSDSSMVTYKSEVEKSNTDIHKTGTEADCIYSLYTYYQWILYKLLAIATIGGLDSQNVVGRGNAPDSPAGAADYETAISHTGNGNSAGPIGSNTGETPSGNDSFSKLYIENSWGSVGELIDGVFVMAKFNKYETNQYKSFLTWTMSTSTIEFTDGAPSLSDSDTWTENGGTINSNSVSLGGYWIKSLEFSHQYKYLLSNYKGGQTTYVDKAFLHSSKGTTYDINNLVYVGGTWRDGTGAGILSYSMTGTYMDTTPSGNLSYKNVGTRLSCYLTESAVKPVTATVATVDHGSASITEDDSDTGSGMTVTFSPNTGYRLKSVSVARTSGSTVVPISKPTSSGTGGTATFTMPGFNVTVTPVFEPTTTLTFTSDGGSFSLGGNTITSKTVGADATYTVSTSTITLNDTELGDLNQYAITFTPSSGYEFVKFQDNAGTQITGTNVAISNINGNTVTAVTIGGSWTLTTGGNGTITIGGQTSGNASPGTVLTIDISPSSGYRLSSITGTSFTSTTLTTCVFSMPAESVTISATFEALTDLGVNAGSNGSVSISKAGDGVSSPITVASTSPFSATATKGGSSATVTVTDTVLGSPVVYTITATPSENYLFEKFTEGDSSILSGSTVADINGASITANFFQWSWTVSSLTHGQIKTESSATSGNAVVGASIGLIVTPDDGYRLKSATATYQPASGPSASFDFTTKTLESLVFDQQSGDVTISAEFEQLKELGFAAGEHGTIARTGASTSGNINVATDATYTVSSNVLTITDTVLGSEQDHVITATADTNWMFKQFQDSAATPNVLSGSGVAVSTIVGTTVTATFYQYSITVNPDPQGHVTVTADVDHQAVGATVTLTASIADLEHPDYRLSNLTGIYGVDSPLTITKGLVTSTFVMPEGNVVITPASEATITITFTNDGHGSMTYRNSLAPAQPLTEMAFGTAATFALTDETITFTDTILGEPTAIYAEPKPAAFYSFKEYKVNGSAMAASGNVSDITGQQVNATFRLTTATYTITFYETASRSTVGVVELGYSLLLPEVQPVTGKVFKGWYTDEGGTGDYVGPSLSYYHPTGEDTEITLYAKFDTITSSTVTFSANSPAVQTISSYVGGTITLPNAPEVSKKLFVGWYSDSSYDTFAGYAGAPYTVSGVDPTLYAKYTTETVTYTFKTSGDAIITTIGDSGILLYPKGFASQLPDYQPASGKFLGWYDSASSGNLIGYGGDTIGPIADDTLYAHVAAARTITFYDSYSAQDYTGNGKNAAISTYEGEVVQLPNYPTDDSHVFLGWTTGPAPETIVGTYGTRLAVTDSLDLIPKVVESSSSLAFYTVTTGFYTKNGSTEEWEAHAYTPGQEPFSVSVPSTIIAGNHGLLTVVKNGSYGYGKTFELYTATATIVAIDETHFMVCALTENTTIQIRVSEYEGEYGHGTFAITGFSSSYDQARVVLESIDSNGLAGGTVDLKGTAYYMSGSDMVFTAISTTATSVQKTVTAGQDSYEFTFALDTSVHSGLRIYWAYATYTVGGVTENSLGILGPAAYQPTA